MKTMQAKKSKRVYIVKIAAGLIKGDEFEFPTTIIFFVILSAINY